MIVRFSNEGDAEMVAEHLWAGGYDVKAIDTHHVETGTAAAEAALRSFLRSCPALVAIEVEAVA